jgi:hypothetical protein
MPGAALDKGLLIAVGKGAHIHSSSDVVLQMQEVSLENSEGVARPEEISTAVSPSGDNGRKRRKREKTEKLKHSSSFRWMDSGNPMGHSREGSEPPAWVDGSSGHSSSDSFSSAASDRKKLMSRSSTLMVQQPELSSKISELKERTTPRRRISANNNSTAQNPSLLDRQNSSNQDHIEISFTFIFQTFKEVKGLRDETGQSLTAADVEKKFREDREIENRSPPPPPPPTP